MYSLPPRNQGEPLTVKYEMTEVTEYDIDDCICDEEHFNFEGVAFYDVVSLNFDGLETVRRMGLFTYTCPAVLDEFTVEYSAEPSGF
jgi:hypothetical protein